MAGRPGFISGNVCVGIIRLKGSMLWLGVRIVAAATSAAGRHGRPVAEPALNARAGAEWVPVCMLCWPRLL